MKSLNPEKLSSSEKKDILAELEADHNSMRTNQAEIRRRWILVQQAVEGRQLFSTGTAGMQGNLGMNWEEAGAQSMSGNVDDESIIFNDLRRVYNTDMQRLTSYDIRPDIMVEDKNDKEGARTARIVLGDRIRKTGVEYLKQGIARGAILRNIAVLKVMYDPRAGRLIKVPKKVSLFGKPLFTLGKEVRPEGDVVWKLVNSKCILLPKFTKRIEDAGEVEEYHVDTVEDIYRNYGVVVKPEAVNQDYFDSLDVALKNKDIEGGSSLPKVENRALLKEKLIRPCPRYPEGATFTWTKETLIRSDKMRYAQMPYFSAQGIFNDDSAFCDSMLWDLLPIQGYLNLGLSATARWLKMISLLRRWIPASAQVKKDDLDNSTSMNSVFEGEKAPQWEAIPELPETVFRLIEQSRDFMASHGYSNELAKMRRALSGNALGILQEMDDTIFRPTLESIQSMLSRAATFDLLLTADCIKTPRLIQMGGRQKWQIEQFKGDMLKGNFSAEIKLMAGMPSNKVLRLEYLKALYKDGLLDKEQVQQHLEFPNDNEAAEATAKQYEIADARIKAVLEFPQNYREEMQEGPGGASERIFVCNVAMHKFDNHALLASKWRETMQESYDHLEDWVKLAAMEHLHYAVKMKIKQDLMAQGVPEAQAEMTADAMAEQDAEPSAPAPGGPQFPGAPDKPGEGVNGLLQAAMGSNQNPGDQPPREQIPKPMNTGFTA